MPNKHRFPTKLAQKNAYFSVVFPFLMDAANRTRLGLDGVTTLDDANTEYTSVWLVKYPLSINENTSTKPIRQDRNKSLKFLEAQLRLIFEEIPSSALTIADRATLNIPVSKDAHSTRSHIHDIPYARLSNLGDGRLRITARTDHDSSRPSIHPEADGIELVYAFDNRPASPAACILYRFSKEARFEIHTGSENVGRKVFAFIRWMNASNPEKSSPFSDMLSTTLGGSVD